MYFSQLGIVYGILLGILLFFFLGFTSVLSQRFLDSSKESGSFSFLDLIQEKFQKFGLYSI
jgi:hypothetical protein